MLEFKCTQCGNIFIRTKRNANHTIKRKSQPFCTKKCHVEYQKTSIKMSCGWCNKVIYRTPVEYSKSKSGKCFCSRSCSGKYNNANKTTGTRRSKLEKWLEQQLNKVYPKLDIKYNTKEEIRSELDIYIPSLKLAFELNGIFHYEPIYGKDKLDQIQNNDDRKFQACLEQGIELCIIDTSSQKKFDVKTSKPYLDIVKSIINKRLT